MFYSLIRFSIYKPYIIIAFMSLLTIFCSWKLLQTSLDIFPEFSPKLVIIQTEALGLSSEQVENSVTRPLESLLSGIPNIEYLRSESIAGLSVLTLTFNEGSSHSNNRQLITERLNGAKNILPKFVKSPIIMPLASSAATIMTIGYSSDNNSLLDLRTFVEQHVAPALLSVKGVADVNIFGGEQKQLNIILNKDKLIEYSIPIDLVIKNLENANLKIFGSLVTSNQEIQVVQNNLISLNKIKSIMVFR